MLIERVRHAAGLTQEDLAERVGTSRTALSAYEHGRKSPTLATAERIVAGAGFALSVEPVVSFREATTRRGRPFFVADRPWRLPVAQALATVTLPLELNWSVPGSTWSLAEPPAGTLLRKSCSWTAALLICSSASMEPCSSMRGRTSCCRRTFGNSGSRSSTKHARGECADRVSG